MLIGPAKVPSMGETVSLTLEFSDGSEQQVSAVVRKGKRMNHEHGHKHKHKHGQKMKHE